MDLHQDKDYLIDGVKMRLIRKRPTFCTFEIIDPGHRSAGKMAHNLRLVNIHKRKIQAI